MDNILKEGLYLLELGFAVHWLRPGQKIPVSAGWSDAAVPTPDQLIESYKTGYNLGFRTGKWSVVHEKEICVLDIDIRGGKKFVNEAFAAAASCLGGVFTPGVISGSQVGRHQYIGFPIGASPTKAATTLRQSDAYATADGVICSPDTIGAKPAWVVEILSTGKQAALPPSIHPDTKKPYKWAEGRPS